MYPVLLRPRPFTRHLGVRKGFDECVSRVSPSQAPTQALDAGKTQSVTLRGCSAQRELRHREVHSWVTFQVTEEVKGRNGGLGRQEGSSEAVAQEPDLEGEQTVV